MSNSLYERDFYAWANEQASLLRAGRLSEADLENIAEEIESTGRAEKRELVSRLKVLLAHLLKWRFQPTRRGNSWRLSIEKQRREVADHLADNSSLQARLPDALASAYTTAVLAAARETGLDRNTFPSACPWTYEQMVDAAFRPEETA
jgi:hypothetical protein